MAATAILRSQDCLLRPNRFQSESIPTPPSKTCRNPGSSSSSMRPRRRKRSPGGSPDRAVVAKFPTKNLVMGQVKILKRGEELTQPTMKNGGGLKDQDLVLSSTDRLGPDPETVQKQIKVPDLKVVDGIYAGSAMFLSSPPPSSLPLPAFFANKEKNDVATSDLRRLLRLDLV